MVLGCWIVIIRYDSRYSLLFSNWNVCVCFSTHTVMQGMLQPFLAVASQTLESFVRSLDDEVKTEDHSSQEHQFVLALAGTITSELNALVYLCITAHTNYILQDIYNKFKYQIYCAALTFLFGNLMKDRSPVVA